MWISFVGVTLLGYSEKEVGHFTLNKYNQLFDYFKKYHNFKVSGNLFNIKDSNENSNEWFSD